MLIMKVLFFLIFISTIINIEIPCASSEVIASFWQTNKSPHFIIYYQEAPAEYVRELIERAEKYYNSIVENFGYRRFDFWSWDNRAKIFLYPSSGDYLKDTNRTAWSGGSVDIKNRTIKTFIGQDNFFDSILPHEMAHIIFREFVGQKRYYPLWLDEGAACSQEKQTLDERLKNAGNLVKAGVYIGFDRLSTIRDYSLVVPNVFYSESASVIVFLLQKYGREKFLDFSRQMREGEKWLDALMDVYNFNDLSDFEAKWKEYYLNN